MHHEMLQRLLHRYEPRETVAVWALCREAELSHVAGPDAGRTAPPPMVANILHSGNSLLKKAFTVRTDTDVDDARRLPTQGTNRSSQPQWHWTVSVKFGARPRAWMPLII